MTKKDNREVLLKNKKYFIVKFISSLFIRVFMLLIPLFYSYCIDEITKGNFNAAYTMIILFFVFYMFYRITEIINQITFYALYSNLYKSYLELGLYKTCNNSLYSLSRFSLSEFSNIMSEDFEILSEHYATLVIRIVEILEAIFIIIYFFKINVIVGYITLFICLVVLYLLIAYNSYIADTNKERKIRNDKRISLFQELLLSIKEIKGFDIFDVVKERTNNTIKDYVKWNNKLNVQKYNLKQKSLGLINIFEFLALLIGIKLIKEGQATVGVLTIIYSYYTKLSDLFLSIITLFESRINVKIAKIRIHKLFQYASDNYDDKEFDNKNIYGDIEFINILYGNKLNPILNNVSFKINRNSLNIITGLSGSGKVGIFELLLGYNRQHKGKILIDNKNITDFSKNILGNSINSVRRDPTFFRLSIKDNLSIFDSNFENIVRLAKELNIHDYIMALPSGYNTILETDANNINSDVKYALAIMRVLLKRPKILLFDETFDFLSIDISKKVLNILKEMKQDNTILIISKKKELLELEYIDNIIVIDNHQVLLTGTNQELIKNKQYKKIISKL